MDEQREFIESSLINICLQYPRLVDNLNESLFRIQMYKDMYADIKQWVGEGAEALHGSMFYSLTKGGKKKYNDFAVQSLIDWNERHPITSEENALKMLKSFLFKVDSDNYSLYVKSKMEIAKELISNGNAEAGAAVLRSVEHRASKFILDTETFMLDAVNDSNGFRTGIQAIDNHSGGWYVGNLLSLCGDTGSMKTRWSLWLMIQILKTNPSYVGLYFEKEMPIKDVSRLLISHFCGIKNDYIIKADKEQKDKIKNAINLCFKDPEIKDIISRLKIAPAASFHTTNDMWKLIETHKANVWCLDYMTLLDGDSKSMGEKSYVVMNNIKQLKNIVQETNSFGIILNQLNKGTVEQRFNKIPLLDDIEWSGDIKKLSAYVLATFYPSLYYQSSSPKRYYILSLKNRDKSNYFISFETSPEFCEFTELKEDKKAKADAYLVNYLDTFNKGIEHI